MFELNKVNAERYADNCCCKSEKDLLKATCALQSEGMAVANNLQRQLDHKIDGQLKYAYSDLCAPVPSIAPLYCSPFTSYGTGMYAGTAAANFNAVNTAINTVAAGGERYTQITKLDLVHTLQYTDCKGNVKVITNTASTVLTSAPSTSDTIVNINTVADKAIDIIIPNGVSIVNQAILSELPTSLPVKGHCAYSVFELQIPVTTAETKSK